MLCAVYGRLPALNDYCFV